MITSDLAFDIGANTGQATAAFLARGLRVVAVEANPKLCAEMRKRFADEIGDGRLVIVDKAISGRKTVILHLNSADSAWGGASASYAARGQAMAGKIERAEVETTTLTEITARRATSRSTSRGRTFSACSVCSTPTRRRSSRSSVRRLSASSA